MKKKILAVMLCLSMGIGMSGCKKESAMQPVVQKTFKASLEVFREFYSDFYLEHRDAGVTNDDGVCIDCQARIIIDGEGMPLMAVCDVVPSEENKLIDLYLFEYDGEEVITKASITNMRRDSYNGLTIYCMEDEIYVGELYGSIVYRVEEEYFVLLDTGYVETAEGEKQEEGFATGLGENGIGASDLLNETITDFLFLDNAPSEVNLSGTDFELFLKKWRRQRSGTAWI